MQFNNNEEFPNDMGFDNNNTDFNDDPNSR
jgi:hypothetical protein